MSEMEERQQRAAYGDYAELCNFNLQKIEQMCHAVETSIHRLEGNYAGFEAMYADIMRQLDMLSSVYAAYNTIAGGEDVLRLKAVLRDYASKYTREGLDFNLVHNLLLKISDARNAAFEDFPALPHHEQNRPERQRVSRLPDYSGRAHRWISFRRGRSWFLAGFETMRVCENAGFPLLSTEEPDYLTVDIDATVYRIKDLFIKSLDSPVLPRLYLLLDGGQFNYAADEIGKRIYARRDFIHPGIIPFRNIHSLSPGRVRLFGKQHIVLY